MIFAILSLNQKLSMTPGSQTPNDIRKKTEISRPFSQLSVEQRTALSRNYEAKRRRELNRVKRAYLYAYHINEKPIHIGACLCVRLHSLRVCVRSRFASVRACACVRTSTTCPPLLILEGVQRISQASPRPKIVLSTFLFHSPL